MPGGSTPPSASSPHGISERHFQIIVLFQNLGAQQAYYARSPAPPLSGILLAGLTPPQPARPPRDWNRAQ